MNRRISALRVQHLSVHTSLFLARATFVITLRLRPFGFWPLKQF